MLMLMLIRNMPKHRNTFPASAPEQSIPFSELRTDETNNLSKTPRGFAAATTLERRYGIKTFVIMSSNVS
jgi:hypothetical protein